MTDGLKELNERFYSLYGRLYENQELLTKKQSDYMAERLFEQYKQEYAQLLVETEPERAKAAFLARERCKVFVPYVPGWLARWLLGRRMNRAAELLLREVHERADRAFDERAAELDDEAAEAEEDKKAEQSMLSYRAF